MPIDARILLAGRPTNISGSYIRGQEHKLNKRQQENRDKLTELALKRDDRAEAERRRQSHLAVEMESLRREAATNPEAMQEYMARDPEMAGQMLENTGLVNERRQTEALGFVDAMLATDNANVQNMLIDKRVQSLPYREGDPGNPIDTAFLAQVPPEERLPYLHAIRASLNVAGAPDVPAAIQLRDRLLQDAQSDDPTIRDSAKVGLGTLPRAGTETFRDRLADDPDLAGRVGDAEADIAGKKKFAEMTGASRAKTIDDNESRIRSAESTIRNIDNAIGAIDRGAQSGYIESNFLPSIRAASIELDQARQALGLDIVSSVTFGALSKGELDLALDTAVPSGLQPEELKDWLLRKREAQEKLIQEFDRQIEFLDGGGTIAGYRRQYRRQTGQQSASPQDMSDDDLLGTLFPDGQ